MCLSEIVAAEKIFNTCVLCTSCEWAFIDQPFWAWGRAWGHARGRWRSGATECGPSRAGGRTWGSIRSPPWWQALRCSPNCSSLLAFRSLGKTMENPKQATRAFSSHMMQACTRFSFEQTDTALASILWTVYKLVFTNALIQVFLWCFAVISVVKFILHTLVYTFRLKILLLISIGGLNKSSLMSTSDINHSCFQTLLIQACKLLMGLGPGMRRIVFY